MSDGPHDTTLFAFNDNADVELVRIGRCGIKVSVIDNVLQDPKGVAALGFYPARILHAARIEEQFNPPTDRSEWRLTVTALLHSAPSAACHRSP